MRYRPDKLLKQHGRWLLLILLSAGIAAYQMLPGDKPSLITATPLVADSETLESGQGERLRISKLDVDTAVEYVGIEKDGNMGTPNDALSTAWYKHGVYPGETGNAVITGHLNYRGGRDGVFSRLGELNTGDHIEFISNNGRVLTFAVVDSQEYDLESAPRDKIFGLIDQKMLNLITCSGTWDQESQLYTKRRVVFSRLVE